MACGFDSMLRVELVKELDGVQHVQVLGRPSCKISPDEENVLSVSFESTL